ncbi:MAG: hypothetical protein AAFX99_32035, partial [Myxococcota bacterium]
DPGTSNNNNSNQTSGGNNQTGTAGTGGGTIGGSTGSNGGTGPTGGTGSTGGGTGSTSNRPGTSYSFVLVEDQSSSNPGGDTPGADIDAISVSFSSTGVEAFAVSVEDSSLGGGTNLDITQAIGAPDSGCEPRNFVSLGGSGGYIMVSFGQTSGSGDSITVYELGPTTCPNQPQWIDEDYDVSVSVSTNLSDFSEIGRGGAGVNTLRIP